MKKVLLIGLMFAAFQMNAQDKPITFGVKVGANFSNVKIDFEDGGGSPDGATSFFIGGLVDFAISEKVHLQPELLYSIEGAKDADISFLNLPIMLKYYLIEGLNIQLGPQIGFLLDAEGGTDGLKSTNFAVNFGAAYELPSGFFIDARYNLGVTNLLEEEPGFEDLSLKSKGFQLGAGYRF